MVDRVKSMKRVLDVQRQVVRLAEWRLGVLKQQCIQIEEDKARLHAFVSADEALSPLLSAAAYGRGQALLKAGAERAGEEAVQSRLTDSMRRRERLAEKLVDRLQAEADLAAEKRSLQEVIEAWAGRDDASFP